MSHNTANQTEDKREKIQALSLAKECYSMKLELLTNATVVDDAIRFVSSESNDNVKSSAEGDKEESKEPDYDEDKDQLEEEQEEENVPGDIKIQIRFCKNVGQPIILAYKQYSTFL